MIRSILLLIFIIISIIIFHYLNNYIIPIYLEIDTIADEYIEKFINYT